jgi:maltooligosyltrehalose trehalohydrolase
VGNRAAGERISHLAGVELAKVGAALLLTSPFVPMLFQGEEWSASSPFQYFTAFEDHKLSEAVRTGRRHEFEAFGWKPEDVPDPQSAETFKRSKLNWEEIIRAPHADMLQWYRQLIRLRKRHPELASGPLDGIEATFDESRRWLYLHRGRCTLLCNLSDSRVRIPLREKGTRQILLASRPDVQAHGVACDLPPASTAILQAE